METAVGCHFLASPSHPYEDRYRLLGATNPRVRAAGRGELYAVMDGVGGAPEGMQAAQLVADGLLAFFSSDDVADPEAALHELVLAMNETAHARGMIPGTDRPVAATAATIAWFSPERVVHLLHVGDTLALQWDGSTILPLTTEHGSGRALHRYIGQGPRFGVDRRRVLVEEGDVICLVTDGVTKALQLDDIARVLAELPDPARAAKEIVTRARNRGSKDDITAVVVELIEW